jgi:hypothetical protein
MLSYFFITMSNLNYVIDDNRDDTILFDDDIDNYFDKSEEERATDDFDAYVYEGLDGPNYISAYHAYYPDLSSWQSDLEASSDGEEASDERSISTLEHYFCNLSSFDRGEAEVRMAATKARRKALCDGLDDNTDESNVSVANA